MPVARSKHTILLTGARNVKALALARLFKRAGHRVLVAEEPHWYSLNLTRFSAAVDAYHALPDPALSVEAYKDAVKRIVQQNQVTLFVPISSPSWTEVDSELAWELRRRYDERQHVKRGLKHAVSSEGCKSFIQHPLLVRKLDRKDEFCQLAAELGLPAPETRRVTSIKEAVDFLHSSTSDFEYIIKSIGFDDTARADTTPLPLCTREDTRAHLQKFTEGRISPRNPYILQRRLSGREYCTHAVVRDGTLRAFVTCRSSDMLMRFVDVNSNFQEEMPGWDEEGDEDGEGDIDDPVSEQAESWTVKFLQRWREKLRAERGLAEGQPSPFECDLTGHFCIDFIMNEADGVLYPIECNPRAHTAVVLFSCVPHLASAYLEDAPPATDSDSVIRPPATVAPQSWIAHALPVALAASLPACLAQRLHPLIEPIPEPWGPCGCEYGTYSPQPGSTVLSVVRQYLSGEEVDPVFDLADPLPFLVLLHLQWPSLLLRRLASGEPWSRANVSTSRIWGPKSGWGPNVG